MDYISKDVLSGELVPVLLGFSAETQETAQRLFRKYGVVSHVFSPKIPLPMRISLCMKFHTVQATANETLLIRALCDFADRLENNDLILYLIPCTEHYARVARLNKDVLERLFVIAEKEEKRNAWLGTKNKNDRRREHEGS